METISILVSGVFSSPVIHVLMLVPPLWQLIVDPVFISVDQSRWQNDRLYQGLHSYPANISKHLDYHQTASNSPTNGHGPTWSLNTQAQPTTKHEINSAAYWYFHINIIRP